MQSLDKTVSFYEKALDGIVLRQQVISHNIANQNTPGYHAKRVAFESALSNALQRGGEPRDIEFPVTEVKDAGQGTGGNNVELETEWMLMEKNRLLHQIFAKALGGTYRKMVRAIRG